MRVGQARKRDWNEAQVRAALHDIGVITIPLSAAGVPDLLCWSKHDGFRLVEVKTPRGKLTPEQIKFRALVPFEVVRSVEEALKLYGVQA